jgi:hypothetical protein
MRRADERERLRSEDFLSPAERRNMILERLAVVARRLIERSARGSGSSDIEEK